jgi:hypothetical protein
VKSIHFFKKILLINKKRIKIACVGQFIPPSANYLKNIFENIEEIEFNITPKVTAFVGYDGVITVE